MEKIVKIDISDKKYPKILKRIVDPPSSLYIRGELPPQPCFAIVGTRLCSPYGKQIAFQIAKDLAEAGVVIVSGMAKGIDAFSHKGCLEAGGKTIAVLGTGLDEKSIYPQENIGLSRDILEKGGALISEYPPLTPGYAANFPKRNRIISGLSLGVLVVEAKMKSGSQITARCAALQKRKVFAVPGSIYSLNSKGSHYLIKHGAVLVESAEDILKKLNIKVKQKEGSFSKTGNEKENLVLSSLLQEAAHIDKIIKITKLPSSEVIGLLAILEIKGKVRNLGANNFTILK